MDIVQTEANNAIKIEGGRREGRGTNEREEGGRGRVGNETIGIPSNSRPFISQDTQKGRW